VCAERTIFISHHPTRYAYTMEHAAHCNTHCNTRVFVCRTYQCHQSSPHEACQACTDTVCNTHCNIMMRVRLCSTEYSESSCPSEIELLHTATHTATHCNTHNSHYYCRTVKVGREPDSKGVRNSDRGQEKSSTHANCNTRCSTLQHTLQHAQ